MDRIILLIILLKRALKTDQKVGKPLKDIWKHS